jgi:hypothetical protein
VRAIFFGDYFVCTFHAGRCDPDILIASRPLVNRVQTRELPVCYRVYRLSRISQHVERWDESFLVFHYNTIARSMPRGEPVIGHAWSPRPSPRSSLTERNQHALLRFFRIKLGRPR